jgi:NAD(P)-dependent dehydrogenase (short-subunit alcohol dehydrogenase family)
MEKVALVTGSSSGIGYETALSLARDGYHTFASMRDTSKAEELKKIVDKENIPITVIELDVDNEASIVAAIKKVMSDANRIDVLVNNAGYGQFGCTEDVQKMFQQMILENNLRPIFSVLLELFKKLHQ